MSATQDRIRQNLPDLARGLICDAQGEFVLQHPGGAFDPRAFRSGRSVTAPAAEPGEPRATGEPPMTGNRMTTPDAEITKAD